jgi:hypothetical protein
MAADDARNRGCVILPSQVRAERIHTHMVGACGVADYLSSNRSSKERAKSEIMSMNFSRTWRVSAAIAGVALLLGLPAAALAGPQQSARLLTYVGTWEGAGLLKGGEEPENFSCRNVVTDGKNGKINYQGRCYVAGLNLTIYGTLRYNDQTRQYEGIMNSNTEFKGIARGAAVGGNIVFDFKQQKKHEGQDLAIDAKMTLKSGSYNVEFRVRIADSDITMSTSVPFAKTKK